MLNTTYFVSAYQETHKGLTWMSHGEFDSFELARTYINEKLWAVESATITKCEKVWTLVYDSADAGRN